MLSASPARVSITFTQDVQKIAGTFSIDVMAADGASVTSGDAALHDDDRSIMTIALEPSLDSGRYVVSWKNVSDSDGDAAEGAFSFYLEAQPSAADLAADEELAKIGADEETPATTASASTPSDAATPRPSSTAVAPPAAEGGDSGTSSLIIVAGVVLTGIALGFGGVRWLTRRRES